MINSAPINMLQIILSATAIIFAVTYPLYSLLRRKRSIAACVLAAVLLLAALLELFDLLAIIQHERMLAWKKWALLAEGCLPLSWLLFTLTFARQDELRSISPPQRLLLLLSVGFVAASLLLPAESFYYSPDFSQERVLFLGNAGYLFYLAMLVYAIIALINLEVTLASAARPARWNMKFEILGAGSLLAALIFYYSQGLLYRTINMNLVPVRTTALLVAVLLIAYSQLRRDDGVKVYVARNLVYKSVVLFAVGLYLVGLGVLGEGMRYFGESFQRSMAMAVVFAAGVGILILLLSEQVKRRINGAIDKTFYQDKYDYRSQWLQFTDRLSSARTGDELLTGILSGYCETFGMGCGALFLRDNSLDGFSPAARVEMEPIRFSFSRSDALVLSMLERKWVVNMRENPAGPGPGEDDSLKTNGFTLAVPLFLNDLLDGFILLGRPLNSNETYHLEDYDLMKTLAHQALSAILNLRLSDQLAEAKEMEALGKVSAFVIHDLKNLVHTLSLVLDNARDYLAEPEFQQDMLDSLDNTVAKMKTLIAKLKYLPEKRGLLKEPVDLLRLVEEAATSVTGAQVQVSGRAMIAGVDREEMHKVALNLLLNAVEASDGKGAVMVEVGSAGEAFIRVTDEGCGIPEEFLRRHLFSPFKSTKKNGLGIGLYQCKQIVEAHGGRIEVESTVGAGSIFTVWLPVG